MLPQDPLFWPSWNASLNAIALIFLLLGYRAVRQRKLEVHKRLMMTAFSVSALFLASYLYYHFNFESVKFQGQGPIRPVYFVILISHIILATSMVPFILRMLWLAWTNRMQAHARLARWVWPVWVYVSFTGVIVYWMLYQMDFANTIIVPGDTPAGAPIE